MYLSCGLFNSTIQEEWVMLKISPLLSVCFYRMTNFYQHGCLQHCITQCVILDKYPFSLYKDKHMRIENNTEYWKISDITPKQFHKSIRRARQVVKNLKYKIFVGSLPISSPSILIEGVCVGWMAVWWKNLVNIAHIHAHPLEVLTTGVRDTSKRGNVQSVLSKQWTFPPNHVFILASYSSFIL
jgi:hypothetical protein